MLTQPDGTIQDVQITIHPPNPKLLDLPLGANLGEKTQTSTLQGSGRDRITRITLDYCGKPLPMPGAIPATPAGRRYSRSMGRPVI
jgi:hypothetical protein